MSQPVRRRTPTMADVAALAGVSHQTVSRVLNGLPGVRPDTARRVHESIQELGYRRNIAARLLASTRSRTVGVMIWGTSQFGPAQVLLGLKAAARESDYRLSTVDISETTPEAVQLAIDQLLEQTPEAVIVVVPHQTVLRIANDIDLGIPTVVVEGDLSRTPLTAGVDNVQGARLATRHLIDLGHETVVHLAGPPGWAESAARVDGWRAELTDAGLTVPALRWGGDWSPDSGYQAGRTLAREKDITAVFAANDQMALGLLAALRDAGRRVPEDVSVVGFDDLPESAYFAPPLTTIRQDFGELGRRAMRLVERVLAGEESPSTELVPTVLVPRASTAPPAEG
jgi:DNA-binding LacI/PurR family transcriptional regulator